MASVFLCEDQRLGRLVAVKRLHPDSTADDVSRRFQREAKLGASLNHPALVAVYDTIADEDGDLIVMEYVEGETLAEALKRGPLPAHRALVMVDAVAAGLDHAHGQGVLHRDVKPGNILLRKDGMVKLADLGIATAVEQTRITTSGTVLGTAAYMAPEQLEGGPAQARTDVYALATVTFEALGGRRARLGATPLEVAHQIATEPPPDVRSVWPDAPAGMADVLARGMARRPEDRPATAGEFARELWGAVAHSTEGAAAHPTVRLAPRPPGRRRASTQAPRWLPVAALAAVVAVATFALVSSGGDEPAPKPTTDGSAREREPDRASAAPAPAEATAAEAQSSPAVSRPAAEGSGEGGAALNQQGFELMEAGHYDEAIPILERAVAAFPPGTSDLNYAYALYNLGRSLRLAGRPDEAIPILERRLQIPNQTATVQRELRAARNSSTDP